MTLLQMDDRGGDPRDVRRSPTEMRGHKIVTSNPYSPRSAEVSVAAQRYSTFCACMFWISSILATVTALIAIGGGYQNFAAHSRMGGTLPPYIVAVTLLVLGCALLLVVSAVNWRKRNVRAGLLTFGFAFATFFAGPRLLLVLLAG